MVDYGEQARSHYDRAADQVLADSGLVIQILEASDDFPGAYRYHLKAGEKECILPSRYAPPEDDSHQRGLLTRLLYYFQLYDECDDFLDWIKVFDLPAGDYKVSNEFDEIGTARWDFFAMIGEDSYEHLLMLLGSAQAIGMAWSSFQNSQNKS